MMPRTGKRVGAGRSGTFRQIVGDSLAIVDLVPKKKSDPEEVTKAVARATEVLGDQDAAFRWLGSPVLALDYATPISCLGTHRGAMRVNDVLTQIEHGVW